MYSDEYTLLRKICRKCLAFTSSRDYNDLVLGLAEVNAMISHDILVEYRRKFLVINASLLLEHAGFAVDCAIIANLSSINEVFELE